MQQVRYTALCLAGAAIFLSAVLAFAEAGACDIPNSGSWRISEYGRPCIISSDQGVEAGDVAVDGYTLTLSGGADFAWNPGRSVTIASGGSIVVDSGSALVEGYVWRYDGDGDDHPTPSLKTSLADPGSGWERRKDLAVETDCDDGNEYVYEMQVVAPDRDRDGYGALPAGLECVGDALFEGCPDPNGNPRPGEWRQGSDGSYSRLLSGYVLGEDDDDATCAIH